jgi:DNA primase
LQLHELWRLSPEPVLCFDGDTAGQSAALRVLDRALPILRPGRSLRFVTLPPGEDPDSLIRGAGGSAFAAMLAGARPLSEMLWQTELAARPIDTPERRADLERRLMAHAGLIADRAVQNEYRRFFRERLFQLGRPARPSRGLRRPGVPPPGVARDGPPPPPPRSPGRVNREVFLAVLVRWPGLIDEWIEEIAALPVPEPELDSLRRAILEIAHAQPGLDADGLQQHLALCGHTAILSTLATTIGKHAGFAARGGDDPEVIRLGLKETLQLLQAGRSPSEVDAAKIAFAADPSAENLQRLTALKERELLDGPIGGMDS